MDMLVAGHKSGGLVRKLLDTIRIKPTLNKNQNSHETDNYQSSRDTDGRLRAMLTVLHRNKRGSLRRRYRGPGHGGMGQETQKQKQ